jgi:Ca-activated chloride channel family protein
VKRASFWVIVFCLFIELSLFGQQALAHISLFLGAPDIAAALFRDPGWKGAALYAAGRWNEAAASFALDHFSNYNMGNALAHAGRYPEALASYERALADDPGDTDAAFNKSLIEAALQTHGDTHSGQAPGQTSLSAASKVGGSRDRPQTDDKPGGSGDGLASGKETESQSSTGGKVSKEGSLATRTGDFISGAIAGGSGTSGGAGHSGVVQPNFPDLLQERESRMRRRQQEANVHPSLEWLQTLADDPGLFLKAKIRAEKARRLEAAGGPIPEDD